jgi:DNA/RNA-binding domain of Phe-tRNA-synthetase-like protein
MKIFISEKIHEICKDASLGVLRYNVEVTKSSKELIKEFDKIILETRNKYALDTIVDNKHIKSTRVAYKTLGKNPSRYRNASEAMLRRVVKGNDLYRINSVVDINNIISISSGYSIGSYDLNQLKEDIFLKKAEEGNSYPGIGKDNVNIEYLPTLYDSDGAFGNPTSDSKRAMVELKSQEIISIIYSFDGKDDLNEWMEKFSILLKKYAGVSEIEKWLI